MDKSRRLGAEFFGTFWLTFGGCGSRRLAAGFPRGSTSGIGFLGVAFAFGLTVLTMAYAVGHISGGHFNPAVTVGLWAGERCANRRRYPLHRRAGDRRYRRRRGAVLDRIGQARLGTRRLRVQRLRRPEPGQVRTRVMPPDGGADDVLLPAHHHRLHVQGRRGRLRRHSDRAGADADPSGVDPGDQHSVNPARSTGPALFAGGAYVAQLWLFWLAPIVGALLAGLVSRWLHEADVLAPAE